MSSIKDKIVADISNKVWDSFHKKIALECIDGVVSMEVEAKVSEYYFNALYFFVIDLIIEKTRDYKLSQ